MSNDSPLEQGVKDLWVTEDVLHSRSSLGTACVHPENGTTDLQSIANPHCTSSTRIMEWVNFFKGLQLILCWWIFCPYNSCDDALQILLFKSYSKSRLILPKFADYDCNQASAGSDD